MDLFVSPSATSASPSTSESMSKTTATTASGASGNQPRHQPSSKTRSSCDRCHAQKLRCVKDEGVATCRRCLRLKTLCRHSPRAARSSLRPRRQSANISQADRDVALPASESMDDTVPVPMAENLGDIGWWASADTPVGLVGGQAEICSASGNTIQGGASMPYIFSTGIFDSLGHSTTPDSQAYVDWDLIFPNDQMKQTLPLINTPNPSIENIGRDINENGGSSPVSTFQRLASLSVRIYECNANLPSPHRSSPRDTHTSYNASVNAAPKSARFIFDELFRVTTEFIDILRCLPNSRSKEDTILLTTSSDQSLIGDRMATQPWCSSHVDDTTVFMIMSCHSSLTETYASILRMMKMCLEHSLVPQMGSNWLVILPRVQVGSVELPSLQVGDQTPVSSKATSSMYMMTVTMLFSRLWTQLTNVLGERVGAKSNTGMAQNSSMVDAMWDTALDKTNRLMQTIDSISSQLH
ncbi:unnamed protein product [Clonostachys rosea]|uniref:Zn(2)-C6 fungal-type domain-containing protein n=1 Tax=Bionectria ochroleuca TaxID=29856 RepID=A0ABY6UK91_BIOOC|nr:unnamed protein product [Clonostachys rosea]